MRKGTDKALAALACAALIGVLGAMSWHSDSYGDIPAAVVPDPAGVPVGCVATQPQPNRDKVIYEIERLHLIWGNYDKGAGDTEGAKSNP